MALIDSLSLMAGTDGIVAITAGVASWIEKDWKDTMA